MHDDKKNFTNVKKTILKNGFGQYVWRREDHIFYSTFNAVTQYFTNNM